MAPTELAEHQARWRALRGQPGPRRGAFGSIPRAQMLPSETLGQYRTLDADARMRRVDEDFALQLTGSLPSSWAAKLLDHWRTRYNAGPVAANLELLAHSREINAAQRAGLPADASDDDLCTIAKESAREAQRRIDQAEGFARVMLADRDGDARARLTLLGRCAAALSFLDGLGLADYFRAVAVRGIEGALRRVIDDRWWRRLLRKVHARAVEGTARAIGLVHARAGCYASDDACKRRRHQRARNAATLESVLAINERGQTFTLAELAAKGPANKEIRRHELMTRIKGFDLTAVECDDLADFVTVTCPSRMHRKRMRVGGGVEDNPSFDGTLPEQAQRWLCGQWAKVRASLARKGIRVYGFRIAEPNHDGTPHWHLVLFYPKTEGASGELVRVLQRYFWLADSPHEHGAEKHRVKVKPIDRKNGGSAVGYVAKYVAKNIDGYKVGRDLFGNDAIEASERVETWAATWRIRQFQQIGGAPVTVWRELRRLNELQCDASPLVAMAIDAANTTTAKPKPVEAAQLGLFGASPEGDARGENAAHGWATYLHLQGGPCVRRKDLRLHVLREETGEIGRYGELIGPRPVGIVATAVERFELGPFGIILRPFTVRRLVRSEVESERYTWIIVPRSKRREVLADGTVCTPLHPAAAGLLRAIDERRAIEARRPPRPWSPVNNCTCSPIAGVGRRRVRKRGWVTNWRGKREARPI